ncbi:MAG: MBL fold metallo-hydrolase [Aeropyrum sp.]|nr:MBL fold metallo-hydrolase [Aeropyrum sp.]
MTCTEVYMLGTGSALHPARAQSSILVDTGYAILLVDAGCSSLNNLLRTGRRLEDLDAVAVTHAHYDHICGLGLLSFITQFRGRQPPIVVAPRGSLRIVEEALALGARSSAKPSSTMPEVRPIAPGEVLSLEGGLKIRALAAEHTVEALGFEVSHRTSGSIVVSGDTRPAPQISEAASRAALTIHEATLPSGMEGEAHASGHSTVAQALEIASLSELGALYHLTPLSEAEAVERARGSRVLVPQDLGAVKIC